MTHCPSGYIPPWREASWSERGQIVLAWIIASAIGLGLFIAALFVVGRADDAMTKHHMELDRCQKAAATPYEYFQCK